LPDPPSLHCAVLSLQLPPGQPAQLPKPMRRQPVETPSHFQQQQQQQQQQPAMTLCA